VIAIIARSAFKLTKSTLGSDRLLWSLFIASAIVTAWTESELVWLFVLCGVVTLVARTKWTPPTMVLAPWLVTGLHGDATAGTLWSIAWYFAEAGAFIFGSGLAIVPFLHGGVVNDFRWLTERQFLDAVAVAMITPGPVVITVAFIGYLVAGPLGAGLAALGVFLPCYLFVVVPATYFGRAVQNQSVKAFVDGVTAAAAGAIAGAAFVLGRRAVFDLTTGLIALATLVLLGRAKVLSEPILILTAGVVGVALRGLTT